MLKFLSRGPPLLGRAPLPQCWEPVYLELLAYCCTIPNSLELGGIFTQRKTGLFQTK